MCPKHLGWLDQVLIVLIAFSCWVLTGQSIFVSGKDTFSRLQNHMFSKLSSLCGSCSEKILVNKVTKEPFGTTDDGV